MGITGLPTRTILSQILGFSNLGHAKFSRRLVARLMPRHGAQVFTLLWLGVEQSTSISSHGLPNSQLAAAAEVRIVSNDKTVRLNSALSPCEANEPASDHE